MSGLIGALGLLTRVPLPAARGAPPGRSLPWFPVVGALLGLVTAVAYAASQLVLPTVLSAALALAVLVLLTGAIHEDGLADAADAWGGGADRDSTLRILDDPRIGSFGALAIAFSVIIRVGALAALWPSAAVAALPATLAMSRAATVALMATTAPAKAGGLGAQYGADRAPIRAGVAVVAAVAISAALLGISAAVLIGLALASVWLVRRIALRRIGGFTGDVLGATAQLAEASGLVALAVISRAAGG